MPDDPRVQQLLEEILDSGSSAEDVCRDAPELLPQVRARWRRFQAVEARIGELFPESGAADDLDATPPPEGLPRIPGYDLIEVLGRGGVGVVYKAVHLSLNRTVALKMLLAGAFATRPERQRFAREAEVVARLRHPNIVQVYDVGDLDGRPYFTMEFVEGGSLAAMLAGTPRPARQAAELLAKLADAIEAAHRGGIVHRDLKPSNVLLTADGTPKIGDFGLARHMEVGSSLTQSGAAVGTPSYMAPEQAVGKSSEAGPASDLYALGAVLYELLTGRPPFRAASAAGTVHQVLTRDPVPPSRLNAMVPRDLETICLKCLRKDPRLRYDSAAALAADLRRFLSGEAIAARPENGAQRLARRVRRRPVLFGAFVAGTLLAATLVGGGLWLISERAATGRAADGDLREMVQWLERSSWPEAHAALERAKGRLGEHGGSAGLRRRLDKGARDLELVRRLDAVLVDHDGNFAVSSSLMRADEAYEVAFHSAGLGRVHDPPEEVARRVRDSNVREAILAALDIWAAGITDPGRRDWLLAVARLVDRDSTGWRARARAPATWVDKAALAEVIADAPVGDRCVPLMLSLQIRLVAAGEDSIPFLKRVQRAHSDDFWANYRLAEFLKQREPQEAIRYFQAALALRPGAAIVRNNLGVLLETAGQPDEAIELFRQATRIDPASLRYLLNLAATLRKSGRIDEAIEQCRIGVRLQPRNADFHREWGLSLEAGGRLDEAVEGYRKAVTLDPRSSAAQRALRTGLLRQGRVDAALAAWQTALGVGPPEHDAWYGYAEFCAFLGRDDEYRRARRALLEKFGASADPFIAERTARACLLRQLSGAELHEVVSLGEHAWLVDRSKYPAPYPFFLFLRGLAEYRRGHLDESIALMQGDASHVLGPAPRLVIAMALHRSGQRAEARKTLAAAVTSHDWGVARVRDQDDWIYHSLRREAEGMIVPDLPAFLKGTYQPRDNDERLSMLGACQFAGLPITSVRLYAEAFATDPRLADDLRAGHRYNAARAATLAGCGRGVDAAELGEPERRRSREQARCWLRADLTAWSKMLDDDPVTAHDPVRLTLARWRSDPDLTGLREPAEMDKLPADERNDCLSLWDEVGKVNERAGRAR